MEEVRIGVIGVGGRGGLANHAHQPKRNARIVAGADPSEKNLATFSKKYPQAKTYSDYKELLASDVNAVFICSPDYVHEEQTLAALEAGKAVYLEKPMAITIEGCDKILRLCAEKKGKLYLGHNMRHFASVLKMKELIESGAIGELKAVWCRHFINYGGDAYFKDWHSEQKYSNGLLLQKAAHDIDVIHWLSGSYGSRVVGMGKLDVYDNCQRRPESTPQEPVQFKLSNWPPAKPTDYSPVIDIEDHNMIMFQMENGVQASYTQCHYTPDSCRNYTFIGTEGRIENVGDAGYFKVLLFNKRTNRYPKPSKVYRKFSGLGGHGGADKHIVDRFLDYIQKGTKPNTSPIAARQSVAVGCMATDSLRNGNTPQVIPPLPEGVAEYFG